MHTRIFHASNYIQYTQHLEGLSLQRQHIKKTGGGGDFVRVSKGYKTEFLETGIT